MSIRLSLSEAAIRYGGTLAVPDCEFGNVSIDSRTIQPGDLFVAIRGERFDGHAFLEDVINQACGLVVEQFARQVNLPQWVVPDTVKALGQLAYLRRERFEGPVIAITGSSGKTTVKEMTAAILARKGPVLYTRGNLNNELGVPLTLLRLSPEHHYAVIEMGASAIGDIAYLCTIAHPVVALVNNVLPAHIAGFGSVDNIARGKGEIYESLTNEGTAVINLDQVYRNDWVSSCNAGRILTFSVGGEADFSAHDAMADDQGRYHFLMATPLGDIQVSLPVPGKHNIANALAAAACAAAVGATAEDIAEGLNAMPGIPGRMQRLPGLAGSIVIDDSYNANPGSIQAAVNVLAELKGRKILVLGDMAELGDEAAVIHGEVGRFARGAGVDALLAVGPLSYETVREFGQGGQHFLTKQELIPALKTMLNAEAVVLVKGSRSSGMEEVVNAIIQQGGN